MPRQDLDVKDSSSVKLLQESVAQLDLMSRLLRSLAGPEYEYSSPYTFGGPSAIYRLTAPFNGTPCEVQVASFQFGGAGTLALAIGTLPPTITNTTILDPTAGQNLLVGQSAGVGMFPLSDAWYPVPAGSQLVLVTSLTGGNAASVSVQFRRCLVNLIPETGHY